MTSTPDGTVATAPDGTHTVTFRRDYPTSRADVWSAITAPERVSRWLGATSGQHAAGAAVTVAFDDGAATFDIEACDEPHRLVVWWRHDAARTRVEATLEEIEAHRTRLTLVHTGLSRQGAAGYAGGWHWYLDALGELLGAGAAPAPWEQVAARYAAAVSPPASP